MITCSSGTYIRAIARDLGIALDSEGCLLNLRRIKASGFSENSSYTISDLEKAGNNIVKFVVPIERALQHIPEIILSTEEDIYFWKTGRRIPIKDTSFLTKNLTLADCSFFSSKSYSQTPHLYENFDICAAGEKNTFSSVFSTISLPF